MWEHLLHQNWSREKISNADKSAFSQIIGKIIDIKKLNLEFIDQIINIGKCIEFDPIYTRKTKPCYFVLLKSFLQLLNAVQRFLQPFRAVLANLISKLDFLTWKYRWFERSVDIEMPGKVSKKCSCWKNDFLLTPTVWWFLHCV